MTHISANAEPDISMLEWRLAISQATRRIFKEGWIRQRDERATDPSITPERLNLVSADIRHLSPLIGQLTELRSADESDEYGILRASEDAYNLACQLLIDAAIVAAPEGRQIPYGCASTDPEGGVRIEWIRPTSSVHLVVPAASNRSAYIYHEVENSYATEPATPELLAHWLREVD